LSFRDKGNGGFCTDSVQVSAKAGPKKRKKLLCAFRKVTWQKRARAPAADP